MKSPDAAQQALNVTLASAVLPPTPAHVVNLAGGVRMLVRTVTPDDAPAMVRLLESVTAEEIWLRFFHGIRHFGPALTGALVHADDPGHVGLVALPFGGATDAIVASAILVCVGDGREAEFAMLVHHDYAHHGLGRHLLECLFDGGRRRGISRVYGLVLRENETMLKVAQEMGGSVRADPDESGCMRVEWVLAAGGPEYARIAVDV